MFVNPTTILLRTYAPAPQRARKRTRAPHVRAELAHPTDEQRESPAREQRESRTRALTTVL